MRSSDASRVMQVIDMHLRTKNLVVSGGSFFEEVRLVGLSPFR